MAPKLRVLDFPNTVEKRLIVSINPREDKVVFSRGGISGDAVEGNALDLICREYKLNEPEKQFLKNVFESYREVVPSSIQTAYTIKCGGDGFSSGECTEDIARKIIEGDIEFKKSGFIWLSERSERPNMPNEDFIGEKLLNRLYSEEDRKLPLSKRRMTGTPSPKILLASKNDCSGMKEISIVKDKVMDGKDLPEGCNLIFSVVANAFSYGAPLILIDGVKCKILGSAFFVASPLRYTDSMELDSDECLAAEKCVKLIGDVADKTGGKMCVFLNQGRDAGSSIPHIHFQIFIVWPDVVIPQANSCDFEESSSVYSENKGWWITLPECPMWKNHFNVSGNSFSKVVEGIGEVVRKIRGKYKDSEPNKIIQFNSTFHYDKEKSCFLAAMRIIDPKYSNTLAGLELLGNLGGTDRKEEVKKFLKDNLFNY